MSKITGQLGYEPGETIHAIGKAYNSKGEGPFSDINTIGTLAQVKPQAAVTNFRGTATSTSITLNWSGLVTDEEKGFAASISYAVFETTSVSNPTTPLTDNINILSHTISTVNIGEE